MEKDLELVEALKSRPFTSVLFAFNAVFFMAAYVGFMSRDIELRQR